MNWGHRTETHRRLLIPIFLGTILVAATLPMFFDIYRAAYFGTMSYDNYSRYLLWVLREPGGELPPSPHVYRLGSVILAAPFYLLPLVQYSGEDIFQTPLGMKPELARALQAMCAANVAYASLSACLGGLYLALRRDVSLGWVVSFIFAFLLLTRYLGMGSADGIAMLPLMVAAMAMVERNVIIFVAVVALGTLVNEKVALISFVCCSLRALFVLEHRKLYLVMAGSAAIVLAAYAATVFTLALPGLENQRDPSTYLSGLVRSLSILAHPKGIYQNLWPVILIFILWWASIRQDRNPLVYRCDIGVVVALFVFVLALDVQYNVGRIIMSSMPLFLLGAIENMARSDLGFQPNATGRPVSRTALAAAHTAQLRSFAGGDVSEQP